MLLFIMLNALLLRLNSQDVKWMIIKGWCYYLYCFDLNQKRFLMLENLVIWWFLML